MKFLIGSVMQCCLTAGNFAPRETFKIVLIHFLIVVMGTKRTDSDIPGRSQGAPKHSAIHRAAPTQQQRIIWP